MSQTSGPGVSVIILTKNEVGNIAKCLDSCAWCDDVHVLDSGSTDGTVETAESLGVPVHFNAFQGFGTQRNWAIDNIDTRHHWQFHLDADERFTPELVDELRQVLADDATSASTAAFFVPSKLMFMGRWLRYSGAYPTYQVRFFHRERCRFVDFGHGQREDTQGKVEYLSVPYLHFNFSKGLADWFAKHNTYSSREAAEGAARAIPFRLGALLRLKGVERRRSLKNMLYNVPGRPFLRFFYSYILKMGFRDGRSGLHYCLMMAVYEYMIEVKMFEERCQEGQ